MDAEQIRDGVKYMQQGDKAYGFNLITKIWLFPNRQSNLEPLKVFLESLTGTLQPVIMNVQVKKKCMCWEEEG